MLRKKAILLLFISLLAIICLAAPALANAATTLAVNSPANVDINENFSVSINVNDVSGLAGVQFDLAFDPGKLEVLSLTSGNIFTGALESPKLYDNILGKVQYGAIVLPPQTYKGSGVALTVNFKAKAEGISSLTLSNTILGATGGSTIDHKFTSASITVNPCAPLQVTGKTPAENAINVELNAPVSVTFDRNVTLVNQNGVSIMAGSTEVGGINATLAADNRTINIAHNEFAYNTTYTVNIPAGAVKNDCGQSNSRVSWSFTTKDRSFSADIELVGNNISPDRPLTINGTASKNASWQISVKDSSGKVVKDYPEESGEGISLVYTPEIDLPVMAQYTVEATVTPSGGTPVVITKTFNICNYPLKVASITVSGSGASRTVTAVVENLNATGLSNIKGICQVTKTDSSNKVTVVSVKMNTINIPAAGATLQFSIDTPAAGNYQVEVYLWSLTEKGWVTLGQKGTASLVIAG